MSRVLIVKLVEQKRGLRLNVGNSCMADVFFLCLQDCQVEEKIENGKRIKRFSSETRSNMLLLKNTNKNSKLLCGICLRGRLISLIYEETLSFLWNANFSGGKHESDIKREDWKVEKNPVWKNIFLASKDFFCQTLLNSYIESKSYASKQG